MTEPVNGFLPMANAKNLRFLNRDIFVKIVEG